MPTKVAAIMPKNTEVPMEIWLEAPAPVAMTMGKTPKIDNSIGNPHFLAQLQSGEAELYATFEGNDVGTALSVNVDGSGRSYIVIDYKNLKILRQREEQALDAL